MCDYSVRLNWEGRGRRKTDASEEGHISFSAYAFSAGLDAHVQKKITNGESDHLPLSGNYYGPPPSIKESQDLPSAHTKNKKRGKATSSILPPAYAAWDTEGTAQTEILRMKSDKQPVMDITAVLDPGIMAQDLQQTDIFRLIPYEPPGPLNDQQFSRRYERDCDESHRPHHPAFLPVNAGPSQRPNISRLRPSSLFNNGLESPPQSSLDSPTNGSFIEFTVGSEYMTTLSIGKS